MAVNVGSAVGYLDLDISGFLKGMREANQEAQSFTGKLENTLGSGLKSIGGTLTSAGSTLTKGLTVPIVGAGAAAIKTTADFDSSMSKVSAVSGAVGKDFDALRSKAREMGATTKFSASDAADAMNYMAMAGWKTEDMLSGISGIMNLAAASGEDLATTSDIVTDALTAFGHGAEDSGRLADIMAAAASNANTNVAMMGESFKYVAPVAGALGYSMEDTSVAIGLMANAGIKASQGGTALRTMLTNLSKPTDEMQIAMEALGVSLVDDEGNMKSLRQVMTDLRSGFGELMISEDDFNEALATLNSNLENGSITEDEYGKQLELLTERAYGAEGAEKARYAAMLAGKTGMSGLLAIVNASQEDFDKLTESIDNSTGTAEHMAKVMQDNLNGQITILMSALQELAISFGDILMPKIREVVAKVQDLVAKFNSLSTEQKQQVIRFALIAASIGPVLLVIGKLLTGVATMITTFKTLKGAVSSVQAGMSILSGAISSSAIPIVAIVAIIGVLIAAFVRLWKTNDEFRNAIINTWKTIQQTVGSFIDGIKERFNSIGITLESVTKMLRTIWDGFCSMLAPVFEAAFKQVANVLKTVLDIITGLVDIFIGVFTGNWAQAWNGVKEVFAAIWNGIKGAFSGILTSIQGLLSGALNWIRNKWNEAWNNVTAFFRSAWESILAAMADVASRLGQAAQTAVELVTSFFQNLPYNLGYICGLIIANIIKFVADMVTKARELGTKFLQTVISFFQQLPSNIHKFATDTYNGVVTWANNTVAKGREAGSKFLNAVASFFSQLPSKVASLCTQVISKLAKWASDMATKGREGAKRLWDGVVNGLAGLPGKMASIGSNIVSGVWKGIQSAAGWFRNSVKSFFSGIVNAVKSTLGIGSPSKVFAKEVGQWLPPGVEQGIEKAMPKTTRDIVGEFNDMVNTVSKGIVPIVVGTDVAQANVSTQFGSGSAYGGPIDYYILATILYQLMKEAPIEVNPQIYMEDGDVYFDTERVGRKVAPVVSRVVAMGGG